MAKHKFAWNINNFSSLQCKKCHSDPVLIGDFKWRLGAYPKGKNNVDYFCLYLEVADFESLPSGRKVYAKFRLTVGNPSSLNRCEVKEAHCWFEQKHSRWGWSSMIPLTKLNDEKKKFLVNGELMIIAEIEVLEVIGTSNESDKSKEATNPLKKRKLNDDGVKSNDTLKEASSIKESMDVNGFQVLPSQVESVRRIFERHPDIAVEFRARNQYLRNACMNSLLSLIETLRQSVQELSNEDLLEADIALTYVKDAGFKVDWLEKKLNQVKDNKEKERSALAELSATRTPLSFDDVF